MASTLGLLFTAISSLGLILGNATALATERVTQYTTSGSAMIGVLQFVLAALASPLVGLAGEHSTVPMELTMLAAAAITMLCPLCLPRGAPSLQDTENDESSMVT